MFEVEGIRKCVGHALPGFEATHHPLVPTGDEDDIWINLQSSLPLLLEIVSMKVGVRAQAAETVGFGIAATTNFRSAHRGQGICLLRPVLSHAHGDQLILSGTFFDVSVLRKIFQPTPLIGSFRATLVSGLRWAEREEVADRVRLGSA